MSDYKSKYNNNVPTGPAQYLTDIMCEREATKLGRHLFSKYWQDPFWKIKYSQHIVAVNALLKIYPPNVIELALKRKDALWITSFRLKKFNQICREEQIKLDEKEKKITENINKATLPEIEVEQPLNIAKPFSKKKANKLDG